MDELIEEGGCSEGINWVWWVGEEFGGGEGGTSCVKAGRKEMGVQWCGQRC